VGSLSRDELVTQLAELRSNNAALRAAVDEARARESSGGGSGASDELTALVAQLASLTSDMERRLGELETAKRAPATPDMGAGWLQMMMAERAQAHEQNMLMFRTLMQQATKGSGSREELAAILKAQAEAREDQLEEVRELVMMDRQTLVADVVSRATRLFLAHREGNLADELGRGDE